MAFTGQDTERRELHRERKLKISTKGLLIYSAEYLLAHAFEKTNRDQRKNLKRLEEMVPHIHTGPEIVPVPTSQIGKLIIHWTLGIVLRRNMPK